MVAYKTERRVYLWKLVPRPIPREGNPVTYKEVIDIIKAAFNAGTAELYLDGQARVLPDNAPAKDRDPKNRVYVSDLKDSGGFVTLLINRGDPNLADPAYIDSVKKTVRTEPPKPHESQGWSAHLVISNAPNKNGEHHACFERMPHANSWMAETLIGLILERYAEGNVRYIFKVKVKKNKKLVEETRTYRPALAVQKVPSEQLKEDIKKGVLSSITLINSKYQYNGPDAPKGLKSAKGKLVLRPQHADENVFMEFLKNLAPWAKDEGYGQIQISIKDLPGGASSSPTFDLEKDDAANTLYIRTQRLTGFSGFLQSCYQQISPDIRDKMVQLLNDPNKW